jgi:hypothetical protein
MIDGRPLAKGGFGFHATHTTGTCAIRSLGGKIKGFPGLKQQKPTRGWFVALQQPLMNEVCPMHWGCSVSIVESLRWRRINVAVFSARHDAT